MNAQSGGSQECKRLQDLEPGESFAKSVLLYHSCRVFGCDLKQMQKQFEKDVFDVVYSLNKTPIVWQGVMDSSSMPSSPIAGPSPLHRRPAVVQPWKCWSGLAPASGAASARAGHSVVTAACLYLDWDHDWVNLIANPAVGEVRAAVSKVARRRRLSLFSEKRGDDVNRREVDERRYQPPRNSRRLRQDQFIGGEGAVWTEMIDFSSIECRMWPRTAAIAAVLWGMPAEDNAAAESMRTPLRFPIAGEADGTARMKYYSALRRQIHLIGSYAFMQQFIKKKYGVDAAPVYAHIDSSIELCDGGNTASIKSTGFYPLEVNRSAHFVRSMLNELTCAEKSGIRVTIPAISSVCFTLPKHMRTPVIHNSVPNEFRSEFSNSSTHDIVIRVKFSQLNIANGGRGEGPERLDSLQQWLLQRDLAGDLFVGLCELNTWQNLRSNASPKSNFAEIAYRAAAAGFIHSHVLTSSAHPYNIGIVSVLPFSVLGSYGPPQLLRGMLHVYFPSLDLHVFVLHLTPHSALKRRLEAKYISSVVSPLVSSGAKIVMMGDFNTLSPSDHDVLYSSSAPICLDSFNLNINNGSNSYSETYLCKSGEYGGFLNALTQKRSTALERLINKYTVSAAQLSGRLESNRTALINLPNQEDSQTTVKIDYEPFLIMLDIGFREVCDTMCGRELLAQGLNSSRRGSNFTACMLRHCGATEPTYYDFEVRTKNVLYLCV